MRVQTFCIVGAGLATLLLVGQVPQAAENASSQPFAPGETLTYDVTWTVFPAGQVTATLARVEGGSPESYEVVTTARSQGFVSLLYKVQNEFRSLFDPRTTCSKQILKKINEGRRHRDTRIVFDAAQKLAVLDETDPIRPDAPHKHAENEIPSCVTDVITAFYFVRRQPLRVGEQIRLPINDGAKTYEVSVEIQAREQIQTPLGTRPAFRVEPRVFGGLYPRKGRMLVWFSDDEQRLPLRIKAAIAVGTITGTLRSVSPLATNASPGQ
jgi:hypothetical protein